jgi:hypothetical protein
MNVNGVARNSESMGGTRVFAGLTVETMPAAFPP